ncbi:hypothetical protein ACOME3_004466 [Neoechinorhynchus agilis]
MISSRFWPSRCTQFGFYDPLMAGTIDSTGLIPHDQAITRAYNHKPHPPVDERAFGPVLFIGRLDLNDTEKCLMEVFSRHMRVESIDLIRDFVTGHSRRYAFVKLRSFKDVDRFCRNPTFRRQVLGDRVWVAEKAFSRGRLPGWRPRRFGGGLGGRKESGQLRFGGNARPFKQPIRVRNEVFERMNSLKQEYGIDNDFI